MDNNSVCFSGVSAVLENLVDVNRYWIGFSGGIDSTVLLHLISGHRSLLDAEITAIHIDHQISKNSSVWARHCEAMCKQLGVPFKMIKIDANHPKGSSPEAYARQLRYAAIRDQMDSGDVLLTAHHQDDLAETFLLQLMRGAGPEGLACMPHIKKFGEGWQARPLLGYTRKQLEFYASDNDLKWIEDESNINTGLDRNYIRNVVLSCLEQRWPSVSKTIARSAGHQADVIEMLNEIGKEDFEKTQTDTRDKLNIQEFEKLSVPRKKNLLRYWLKINNYPLPGAGIIDRILHDLIDAREDRMPVIEWQDTEVRRYRERLYVMKPDKYMAQTGSYTWHLDKPLDMTWGLLRASLTTGKGIRASSIINNTIDVRFRSGGETIYPAGRHETHKLKKLFQEVGLPPWQRRKIPLLYINDQLVAVTGFWVDEKFNADKSEKGWDISLEVYK